MQGRGSEMRGDSTIFRKELQKILPGYKWTVHKKSSPEKLFATGIMSSGFNRLSTVQVERSDKDGAIWYKVRSAGHGTKSQWAGTAGGLTLARALRGLQNEYKSKSVKYLQLSNQLQEARK